MPAGTRTRKRPVHADYLDKEPTAQHEGFAAYIEEVTGQGVTPAVVGLVQRLYPLYLKSDAVQKAKEEAQRQKEEAAAKAKAAKERKLKERLARVEADRARLLAELGIEPGATVIEAADRFEQEPDADEGQEDAHGVRPVSEPDEGEDEEPQATNVTLTEDDDDLWDDEDEEEF